MHLFPEGKANSTADKLEHDGAITCLIVTVRIFYLSIMTALLCHCCKHHGSFLCIFRKNISSQDRSTAALDSMI